MKQWAKRPIRSDIPAVGLLKAGQDVRLLSYHAGAVALPGILFLFGAPPWWTLGLGGTVATITYLTIGFRESKRQEFWLTPITFFFFWYSIGYGVSAIYAASEAYQAGYLTLVTRVVLAEDLAGGYVLSLCGALSMHAGFLWVRRSREQNHRIPDNTERSDFRLWVCMFLLGLLALMRPQYFDSIGAARAILQLAPFGVMLSYSSLPREYFRLDTQLYLTFLALGNALLIAAAFYDGSKYFSMLAFLPLLSALLSRKRWRKSLPFVFAGGALLYLFVVAPVLMRSREIKGVDSQMQKLEIAAEETVMSFREDTFYAFQEETQKFLYRQFESTATGFIVGDVREHGFKYGETMANLGYAFIPRVLWPDKPIVTRGSWFTSYLGGSGSEEESTTSTGIYSAGELYWNFGLPGIVLGMLVMGGFFGFLTVQIGDGPQKLVVPMALFMNVVARIVEQAAATEVFVLLIYLLIATTAYDFLKAAHARRSVKRGVRPLMMKQESRPNIIQKRQ